MILWRYVIYKSTCLKSPKYFCYLQKNQENGRTPDGSSRIKEQGLLDNQYEAKEAQDYHTIVAQSEHVAN